MPAKRPVKSLHDRILEANERGNRWLADGNEAAEAGDKLKAERCYQKGQFWLDRLNLLENMGEKAGPKQ
jgi:hypothetical protein